MTPPLVQAHFETLTKRWPDATLRDSPQGMNLVGVPNVQTAPAQRWNMRATRVWFLTPVAYPQARPDCFWADSGLRLASGGTPTNSAIQHLPGFPDLGQLLWFSWHLASWDPSRDNLLTYLNTIRRRLRDPR